MFRRKAEGLSNYINIQFLNLSPSLTCICVRSPFVTVSQSLRGIRHISAWHPVPQKMSDVIFVFVLFGYLVQQQLGKTMYKSIRCVGSTY